MLDWFALLVMRFWPFEVSLHPEFIEFVLRNRGVGLEDDTVVVFSLALDVQKDLQR